MVAIKIVPAEQDSGEVCGGARANRRARAPLIALREYERASPACGVQVAREIETLRKCHSPNIVPVSYTHLRAHETLMNL
eukprot:4275164-Prymnesium_polylepis.2